MFSSESPYTRGTEPLSTIHEAFSSLRKESIAIFEQPRLEELHDLRNTIQHKGLIPDSLTAQFLVEIAYRFTKRFLEQELAIPVTEAIPSRYRMFMEGVGAPPLVSVDTVEQSDIATEHEDYGLAVLSSALKEARAAENPTSQIVAAYSVLQQAVKDVGRR